MELSSKRLSKLEVIYLLQLVEHDTTIRVKELMDDVYNNTYTDDEMKDISTKLFNLESGNYQLILKLKSLLK